MKITVVTHDSVFGRYFASTLAESTSIDRVIVENARASSKFYLRKLRRVGPVNFGFQWWLNRWFERQGEQTLPRSMFPSHERVRSINDIAWEPDDLVVAFGTSYVHARTLAKTRLGILNLHTGLLPYYRGVKSEFWTLYNRDYDNVGWTLHFMTPKLDRGDMVLRDTIDWQGENPGVVRANLLRDAVPKIASLLGRMRTAHDDFSLRRVEQDRGAYYTTPTFWDWLGSRSGRRKERTLQS